MRYALSFPRRKKKDFSKGEGGLRVLQGECQCYQELPFSFFFGVQEGNSLVGHLKSDLEREKQDKASQRGVKLWP